MVVHQVQRGPQARNDTAAGSENSALIIDVLRNDLGGSSTKFWSLDQNDPAVQTQDGSVVTLASGARVWFEAGFIRYSTGAAFDYLADGEIAHDTFTYAIRMSNGVVSYATVTVSLTGTNDGPVAGNDSAAANEDDATIHGSVASNDSDPDNGALLIYTLNQPPPAGFSFAADGSWSFDPFHSDYQLLAEGEQLSLTIIYTVTDEHGAAASALLMVTLTGTNDAPVAAAIAAGMVAVDSAPILIELLVGQFDPDGDPLTAVNITVVDDLNAPVSFIDNGDGTISIDPGQYGGLDEGESRTITVSYDLSDGQTTTANTATLVVEGVDKEFRARIILPDGFSDPSGRIIESLIDTDGDGYLDTVSAATLLPNIPLQEDREVDAADIDGDGDIDIVTKHFNGLVAFHQNFGDTNGDGVEEFGFVSLNAFGFVSSVTNNVQDVVFGDFNGDGLGDIMTFNSGTMFQFVNLGDTNGDGIIDFSPATTQSAGPGGFNGSMCTADINGDGRLDVVISVGNTGSTGSLRFYLNQGDTTGDGAADFLIQTISNSSTIGAVGVMAGDLDGDGDADLVLSRYFGLDEVVAFNLGDVDNNGTQDFQFVTYATGGDTWHSKIGDIDGDGDADVISSDRLGNVRILQNLGDTNGDDLVDFAVRMTGLGAQSSFGLDVGDVDGDGDLDIFTASRDSSPVLLTNLGDTDGDGFVNFAAEVVIGASRSWDVLIVSAEI